MQGDNYTHSYLKEKEFKKGNVSAFVYDQVKVINDRNSGKTCVGFAEIISFEKIVDINQAPDTRVLDRTIWNKLKSCMSSR